MEHNFFDDAKRPDPETSKLKPIRSMCLGLLAAGSLSLSGIVGGEAFADDLPDQVDSYTEILTELGDHACSALQAWTSPDTDTQGGLSNMVVGLIPYRVNDQQGLPTSYLLSGYTARLILPLEKNQDPVAVVVHIPAGFLTDYFSRPRMSRWATANLPRYREASVVHDWLYAVGQGDQDDRDIADNMTQTDIGAVMRRRKAQRSLADLSIQAFSRYLSHDARRFTKLKAAVRAGGNSSFGADRELRFHAPEITRAHCVIGGNACIAEWGSKPGEPPAAFVRLTRGQRQTLWDRSVALIAPPGDLRAGTGPSSCR